MKIRRRRLAKLGLFLLAGAVVNVAVAWGAALGAFDSLPRTLTQRALEDNIVWVVDVPPAWPSPQDERRFTTLTYNYVAMTAHTGVGEVRGLYYAAKHRHGWPMRSLQHSRMVGETIPFQPMRIQGAVLFSQRAGRDIALPFRPIPLGFAGNSIFFAFVLSLTTAGIASLRRRRRLTRGLCPRCKYDIRDLEICPECGTAIRRKAAAP